MGSTDENVDNIPESVRSFMKYFLQGPRKSQSERKDVQITSLSHALINCVSGGRIKTMASVVLGLSMKDLTNSKKVIDILNKLGFCLSYSVIEGVGTEIAHALNQQTSRMPQGLEQNRPELCTGVAFDNYDRYVETKSGKNTMHDTVGIVFQNCAPHSTVHERQHMNLAVATSRLTNRRKKYFSCLDNTVDPYVRFPKCFPTMKANEQLIPRSLRFSVNLNNLWMACFALKTSLATSWYAWNAKAYEDTGSQQKNGYLPQINASPTSNSVVYKTLDIALELLNESGQDFFVVTYDLGIASKAYKIQLECSPKFDRLYIVLGSFHICRNVIF